MSLIAIYPRETASFDEGLTIVLTGYGHKIKMDHSDLPFAKIHVKKGAEEEDIRLSPEEEEGTTRTQWATTEWNGHVITIQYAEAGSPHNKNNLTILLVTKQDIE